MVSTGLSHLQVPKKQYYHHDPYDRGVIYSKANRNALLIYLTSKIGDRKGVTKIK
jgi:hypothetical protein